LRAFAERKGPHVETIPIRPDAKTGNQSWPCRELNRQRTPESQRRRSRFGECHIGKRNRGG
jgi:hypothetical protein